MDAKTIVLKGTGIRKERAAAAEITPGHLVEVTSAGAVQPHGTALGFAARAFAVENDLVGGSITTAYASGSRVQYEILPAGSEVNALLADGENVAIGDKLESAGDGTLQKFTTGVIVGIAIEALDLTASGNTAAGRIAVEVA